MINCSKCGKELPDNAEFCMFCGNHVDKVAPKACDSEFEVVDMSETITGNEDRIRGIMKELDPVVWHSEYYSDFSMRPHSYKMACCNKNWILVGDQNWPVTCGSKEIRGAELISEDMSERISIKLSCDRDVYYDVMGFNNYGLWIIYFVQPEQFEAYYVGVECIDLIDGNKVFGYSFEERIPISDEKMPYIYGHELYYSLGERVVVVDVSSGEKKVLKGGNDSQFSRICATEDRIAIYEERDFEDDYPQVRGWRIVEKTTMKSRFLDESALGVRSKLIDLKKGVVWTTATRKEWEELVQRGVFNDESDSRDSLIARSIDSFKEGAFLKYKSGDNKDGFVTWKISKNDIQFPYGSYPDEYHPGFHRYFFDGNYLFDAAHQWIFNRLEKDGNIESIYHDWRGGICDQYLVTDNYVIIDIDAGNHLYRVPKKFDSISGTITKRSLPKGIEMFWDQKDN